MVKITRYKLSRKSLISQDTFHRANFFLGIDAFYRSTRIRYEMNVDTRELNRTFITV